MEKTEIQKRFGGQLMPHLSDEEDRKLALEKQDSLLAMLDGDLPHLQNKLAQRLKMGCSQCEENELRKQIVVLKRRKQKTRNRQKCQAVKCTLYRACRDVCRSDNPPTPVGKLTTCPLEKW